MANKLPPPDTYALPRHSAETARLNAQHEFITKLLTFTLHPSIPTSASPLRVADIACGSGIWLLDIAKQYPHAQCDGFDISSDQFPSKSQLQADGLDDRASFHVSNAADPQGPGAEFVGKFDVVAVRFMHINLLGREWDQAVKNVVDMLKPGGWVQWVDWDPMTVRVLQYEPLAPKAGLEAVLSGFQEFAKTRDTVATTRLPQMLSDNGVADLIEEWYGNDGEKETRGFFMSTLIDAVRGMLKKAGWSEEKIVAIAEEARSDIRGGKAYVRIELAVHVGKKSSLV